MAPPPIQLGIGLSLARAGGAGLDPDAAAYIAAIETAGATVSAAQKSALDTFYRTGKSEGWYSSIKRIYLPIWAVAAANARCMVSGTSGTFNGTVTHGAGFVQGDGSTGYFDPGASGNLRTLGMSGSTLHYMLGVSQEGGLLSIPIGVWDGNSLNRCQITNELTPTSRNIFASPVLAAAVTSNSSPRNGILIGSCTTASSRYLHRRKTAGTTVDSNTIGTAANVPNDQPYIMARRNASPAPANLYYDGRIFAAGYGLAIAQSDAESFSLAIKTLWETCTGLTLP
jgi:hypothetical protein